MRSIDRAGLALSLIVGLLASGCARAAPDGRPRLVLLYATCTLSRDHLGPYARGIEFTPNLDRFAAEGVVFRRHQSESGQSGISFASIFSGSQVDEHGIYTHPNRLPDELYLVTEAFADAGYEPWFWSGHEMASWDLDYGQGVPAERVFEARGQGKKRMKWSFLQPEDAMFQRVLAKLAADPNYRAFLLVNFTVTHGAYQRQIPRGQYPLFLSSYPRAAVGTTMPDLEWAWELYDAERWNLQWDYPDTIARLALDVDDVQRLAGALEVTYRADVAVLDAMFGSTLEQIAQAGLLDDSLIAFTADHGEVLYRENALFKWTHGLQLAPEVLSVPWILRSPKLGLVPGSYEAVTSSIDVYPTLAGLCGIDVSGRGPDGRDLSPWLRGEGQPKDALAFAHTTTISQETLADFQRWGLASRYFGGLEVERIWVRIRDGDLVFKYRNLDGEAWGFQVFDLALDAREEHDLFDPADPKHAAMAERLRAYKARLVDRFDADSSDRPDDALERLERLGYVSDESG